MQFPVPQFTDVEDKIIAGLTFKQFAIVFGAAVFTFVIYTISKNNIVTVATGILTGLPALALTFGKLNGRPLYSSAGNFIRFLFGSKLYIYHKEPKPFVEAPQYTPVQEQAPTKDVQNAPQNILKLKEQLSKEREEEARLIEIIKRNQNKT